jgi:pentatricopeptide repeat protein
MPNGPLVNQGLSLFNSMRMDLGIKPSMDHYTCIVRLLGRAGHLNEALKFVEDIPSAPSAMVWRALLSSCVVHKNVALEDFLQRRCLRLNHKIRQPMSYCQICMLQLENWIKLLF